MSVWLLAPGDRSYQDNIVLLTEIGFLSESLALEYELKAKLERAEGADSDTPFPCFSSASASFVVALDDTFGWLDYEAAPVSQFCSYLRAFSSPVTCAGSTSIPNLKRIELDGFLGR